MPHDGGRYCWCAPAFVLLDDGRLCVVHNARRKVHGVMRVMYWTAVQM